MEFLGDDILIECIKESGYYEYQDVNLDDLPNDKRIAIILAGELLSMRPELMRNTNTDTDLVYVLEIILENGEKSYSLPTKDLTVILRNKPFDDSSIWTYSLKENKLKEKIYKGTGIKWEKLK